MTLRQWCVWAAHPWYSDMPIAACRLDFSTQFRFKEMDVYTYGQALAKTPRDLLYARSCGWRFLTRWLRYLLSQRVRQDYERWRRETRAAGQHVRRLVATEGSEAAIAWVRGHCGECQRVSRTIDAPITTLVRYYGPVGAPKPALCAPRSSRKKARCT